MFNRDHRQHLAYFESQNFLSVERTLPGVEASMGIMLINHRNSHGF